MNPHRRLCSLIRNTPLASAPHFLLGVPILIAPEPDEKAPPQTYAFYFPFLPPVSVAVMSASPHEINHCPMLPHHFLLPSLCPACPEAGFRPLPSQVGRPRNGGTRNHANLGRASTPKSRLGQFYIIF